MTQKRIEELTEAECFALLAQQTVGRIAFVNSEGPGAVPVNYGMAGEEVVVRVAQRSHLREVIQPTVAFEVDHVDSESGSGWSVLVRGSGREVDQDHVQDLLQRLEGHFPRPWAEGVHNVWVVITPRLVTGRRLDAPFFGDIF